MNYHHPPSGGGYAFYMPAVSFMGKGALASAGAQIKGLGLTKALIVTDAVLERVGAVKALTDMLDGQGIGWAVYSGVEPNPTIQQAHLRGEGLGAGRWLGCGACERWPPAAGARARHRGPCL